MRRFAVIFPVQIRNCWDSFTAIKANDISLFLKLNSRGLFYITLRPKKNQNMTSNERVLRSNKMVHARPLSVRRLINKKLQKLGFRSRSSAFVSRSIEIAKG